MERLLVVGGGTMGSGIAFVAARGGYAVEIVEPQAAARERAAALLEREAARSDDPAVRERIGWLDAIPNASEASVAIEAVPERFDLKRDVFVALATALSPDALLATNTSSLAVGDLAAVVDRPERVVGLHFFNPPARMQLLEVVYTERTSDAALERAYDIAEKIGKTAVLTGDTPGFIVNRVARPFYLQALHALERGLASVEELDALARGAGFRMGPFELMDLIGLDVNLATTESIYARSEAERFAPVALQRQMVAQGLLGRKTGRGFYSYADQSQRFDAAVEPPHGPSNADERVVILGFGGRADELAESLAPRYAHVQRIENDDLLDELWADATIVIDAGGGGDDRGEIIAQLDGSLGTETVFFADAYATDIAACARQLRHPERLVGYGVLGSFEMQRIVEVVDSEDVSDDALELAQEFFAELGKGAILVEDQAGLFLGRTVGSIINEAVIAVSDEVASPEDVDTAMRLGANYPMGPLEWGREIGGARIRRILSRLADEQGEEFAPYRALWTLDVPEEPPAEEAAQ